ASASDAWRRLDPSDVHLLFARLLWSPRNLTRIRAEIDEAASLAPASGAVANLRAWLELRLGHPMAAENAARRAVTLAPSEPGFQFTLAQALYSTIRTWPAPHNWKPLRALLKPLWPAATSAGSLNLIAWLYAEMGEPDMAQPFARKAVDTDPACYQCLDTLARVLEDTGFVEEALPIEERALALLPEQIKLMSLVKRLDRLREKVQAAKAVP
ncbi:MAG: tetratricopeptide repeat protein, partial [Myxococcales bacterium]